MLIKSLAFVVFSLCFTSSLCGFEYIAHRGASYDAPENTVASFKLGWEQKADVDELDIYLSRDGEVVVIHDATTKRTAGVDRKVVEQSLAELRALDAGSWKGVAWKGEKIPTLAEAVATIPNGKRMFIEIKAGAEILEPLERVLRAAKRPPEQTAIIGFSYEVMKAAKERFPQLQIYWLASPKKGSEGKLPTVEELIAKAVDAYLDGLNLNTGFGIDATFVARVKAAGLKLYVWTVDAPEQARALGKAGVDGIGTNRAGWLREQLEK